MTNHKMKQVNLPEETIKISANFNQHVTEPELDKSNYKFDFKNHPSGPSNPEFIQFKTQKGTRPDNTTYQTQFFTNNVKVGSGVRNQNQTHQQDLSNLMTMNQSNLPIHRKQEEKMTSQQVPIKFRQNQQSQIRSNNQQFTMTDLNSGKGGTHQDEMEQEERTEWKDITKVQESYNPEEKRGYSGQQQQQRQNRGCPGSNIIEERPVEIKSQQNFNKKNQIVKSQMNQNQGCTMIVEVPKQKQINTVFVNNNDYKPNDYCTYEVQVPQQQQIPDLKTIGNTKCAPPRVAQQQTSNTNKVYQTKQIHQNTKFEPPRKQNNTYQNKTPTTYQLDNYKKNNYYPKQNQQSSFTKTNYKKQPTTQTNYNRQYTNNTIKPQQNIQTKTLTKNYSKDDLDLDSIQSEFFTSKTNYNKKFNNFQYITKQDNDRRTYQVTKNKNSVFQKFTNNKNKQQVNFKTVHQIQNDDKVIKKRYKDVNFRTDNKGLRIYRMNERYLDPTPIKMNEQIKYSSQVKKSLPQKVFEKSRRF